MTQQFEYFTYIMASKTAVLYTGVTGDLTSRVLQHKSGQIKGFTRRYNCHKLVYYEQFDSAIGAITREKQLKKWRREKKEALIYSMNSDWRDLAAGWETDYEEDSIPFA